MADLKRRNPIPSKKPVIDDVQESLRSGPVMGLASKGPIAVYPTTTIKHACAVMVNNGIRRVPVVDAGTRKIEGIISARDLVDFFGGGEKRNIVKGEFEHNLFSAVNAPISKIMEGDVISIREDFSIRKAARTMLESNVGGCPVVDKEGRVKAIISEGDFIRDIREQGESISVGDIMTREVNTVTPGMSLGDAARIMINRGRRRLPVIHDGEMVGMLRTTSFLEFISKNGFARFGTVDAEEIMEKEKVGDAMSLYFVTMTPDDSVEHLVEVMLARRLGGFPVEDSGKIVGIVTEHDVFEFAYSWALK